MRWNTLKHGECGACAIRFNTFMYFTQISTYFNVFQRKFQRVSTLFQRILTYFDVIWRGAVPVFVVERRWNMLKESKYWPYFNVFQRPSLFEVKCVEIADRCWRMLKFAYMFGLGHPQTTGHALRPNGNVRAGLHAARSRAGLPASTVPCALALILITDDRAAVTSTVT